MAYGRVLISADVDGAAAVADAAVGNLTAFVARLQRETAGARVHPNPDVFLGDSGVPDATFNLVARARFAPADARRRIAETIAAARGTGRPFAWWTDPAGAPDLGARLTAAGLKEDERAPLMVAELGDEDDMAPALPEGLEIREVRDAAALAVFADLLADSFEPRAETVVEFFHRTAGALLASLASAPGGENTQDAGAMRPRLFLGCVRGEPVCTSQVVFAEGVAGLYNIVTRTGFRRRGFGAAMTLAAMRAAREADYRTVVLAASAMGEPVYRRLGFEVRGEFVVYAVEP